MGKITNKESLIRTLHDCLGSSDVEKIKRVADDLYEAGGDPIAVLTNIVLNGQPDSSERHAALQALETIDSSALKKIESPSGPTDSQEPEELSPEPLSSPEPLPEVSNEPETVESEKVFYVSMNEKAHGPVSAREIESLLLKKAINTLSPSYSYGIDSEWRPLREQPHLQETIKNAANKLYGPQRPAHRVKASKLLDSASCRIGLHEFKEWRYTNETSCETYWFCRYCPKTQPGKIAHVYGAIMYLGQSDCHFGRTCLRCTHVAPEAIKHEWGEWSFLGPARCDTARLCARCGATEVGEIEHDFDAWTEDNECTSSRKCKRCKHYDFSWHHSWSSISDYESSSSCAKVRHCRNCDAKDYDSTEHKWGAYQYESPTSCTQVRFCLRCHKEDYGPTVHKWMPRRNPSNGAVEHICAHCGKK